MSEYFDPEELEEIAVAMDAIVAGTYNGYEVSIFVSHNDALDLLDEWHKALDGNVHARNKCWDEYSKIMVGLKEQVNRGDEESN
jgi:glucose-6-phosphate isomerase